MSVAIKVENSQFVPSVLIVEDERIVARDIQETLTTFGYDAFAIASSADEAVAAATARCPDIVLMDIRIKGKRDGIDTADLFRGRFGVPVVFLTAHADEATIQRAKVTEPYGYLMKPVKPAELRSAIEVALYRYQTEKRLRHRDRWFSTALHSIDDAVITVDLGGVVTFMNPAAEALTGLSAKACVGRPIAEVVRFADSRPTDSSVSWTSALEGKRMAAPQERAMQRADDVLVVSDRTSPVRDASELLGAVMVLRDVTEQKLVQKQLELSDRLASLGTLSAGVAHEINNPLAVVVATTALIRNDLAAILRDIQGREEHQALSQRLQDVYSAEIEVQEAAHRIECIVADLRQFTHTRPASGPTDVAHAIDLALRATAHDLKHRADIIAEVEPRLPGVALDEIRLEQVLINLLVNAAHAIESGDVERNRVTVNARSLPGHVCIEVRDTGCGMPPEILKRAFEPFFTTKPVGVGTGLGLSISHGLIKSAGGLLEAESEVGRGSVFRVILPAVSAEGAKSTQPTSVTTPRGSGRARVLAIDDEEMIRNLLERVLQDHDVTLAASAGEGLASIERGERFDVILSDLMMPQMTGIDLYEVLTRSHPELARRVVFLSGGAVTSRAADFLAAVPNRCMQKPFDVDVLRELVGSMAS